LKLVALAGFVSFTYFTVFLSIFCSISAEFLALMKRVVATPRIMEIVNFQGVLRTLERLADMLAKIQKALGEYLERERASFPRYV
jgi:dynein heavy chain 1